MKDIAELDIRPANEASWADLQAVFGERGSASRCQCQRYKLQPRQTFAQEPVEERQHRLREQTECGDPASGSTSGLVAHLGDIAVGWCSVEPRPSFPGLRHSPVPWADRDEDRSDEFVWVVSCVLARAGYRRRGVSKALIRAAVDHARNRGARVLEAYPMTTGSAISEELHHGLLASYLEAGFVEIGRPTLRRAVVQFRYLPD